MEEKEYGNPQHLKYWAPTSIDQQLQMSSSRAVRKLRLSTNVHKALQVLRTSLINRAQLLEHSHLKEPVVTFW